MNDTQENKRRMYIAVQIACNRFQDVWSGMPGFVNIFGKFETTIADIDIQSQIQEGKTTGITENKQKEEDEMIQISLQVAAGVFVHALEIGDNELKRKVNYSPHDMHASRDTVLMDKCQVIHDTASTVVADLADYGITPDTLAQQQKEIDDYAAIIGQPRNAIGTRATATARLIELFKQGDGLLKNKLDKLMINYQNSNPEFYNQYHSVRKIVNLGTRHQQEPEQPEEPEDSPTGE